MNREENLRAGREARDEVASRPGRERPHESAIARFIAGIAYGVRKQEHAPDGERK